MLLFRLNLIKCSSSIKHVLIMTEVNNIVARKLQVRFTVAS